jgi:hypothetical protein
MRANFGLLPMQSARLLSLPQDQSVPPRQALLSALGFECLETLVHVLKVVALPHAAHAGGRDRKSALPQLVGDAQLTEDGLLNGERNDGVFDLLWHAIFQHGLLAADLLQRQHLRMKTTLSPPRQLGARLSC